MIIVFVYPTRSVCVQNISTSCRGTQTSGRKFSVPELEYCPQSRQAVRCVCPTPQPGRPPGGTSKLPLGVCACVHRCRR